MPHQNEPKSSRLLVIGVVSFYLVAALAMVVANKKVLNETTTPLFFLFCQLFIAVILFLASDALRLLPDRLTFDINTCKGLVPMVSLNVVGLSLSNYTLAHVDASFYQVARGLVLPFTVVATLVFLHSTPSVRIILACSLVTAGFFVGVFLDGVRPSMVGVAFGVASSLITAIHSVVIKKSLAVVNGSALMLSWYTNLLSAIVLIPIFILVGEVPGIMKLLVGEFTAVDGTSPLQIFLWGSLITGCLGFLMSIASLLSIKVTSPITHMISSAVRGVAASMLGKWCFGDIITSGRASSIGIILLGSAYYTWVKHQESQSGAKSSEAPQASSRDGRGSYERVKMDELDLEAARKGTKPE
ncbi:Triose Phosphate/Phosphate Translocator [Pleurotus pulmonarius]